MQVKPDQSRYQSIAAPQSRRRFLAFLGAAGISTITAPVVGNSQTVSNNDPTVKLLLTHLQTSRDFTLKVADAMPETGYSYKLTPEQMSFGEQLVHLSKFDAEVSHGLSLSQAAVPTITGTSKSAVMLYVKDCFDYAIAVVGKLDAAALEKHFKTIEGDQTGLNAILIMLEHTAHHRAQAEMYLRAQGAKPPSYML